MAKNITVANHTPGRWKESKKTGVLTVLMILSSWEISDTAGDKKSMTFDDVAGTLRRSISRMMEHTSVWFEVLQVIQVLKFII